MEGPLAHSIYPRCSSPYSFLFLPARWKFTFPPSCSSGTVCLSRFLLKSRWWLCPSPFSNPLSSNPSPSPPGIPCHPSIPLVSPRLFHPHRFSFLPFFCNVVVALPRARSTSSSAIQGQSSIYGEITLRWPIIENMPSNNARELFVASPPAPPHGAPSCR